MKNKFTLLFCFLISFSGLIAQIISGVSKVQSFNVQKIIVPPILVVKDGSIKFFDDDKNGRLDAYESASLSFVLQNIGKGSAFALRSVANISSDVSGLIIEKNQELPTIAPGESQYVTIHVKGSRYLTSGKVNLEIIVKEPNGLDCSPIQVGFNTLKFQEPKIELVDGVFSTDDGNNTFKKKIPAKLNIIVQNTGQSKTDRITVNVNSPSNVLALDGTLFNVGSLSAGESYSFSFGFIATSNYNEDNVTFNVVAKEGFGKYGSSRDFSVVIDQKLDASKLVVPDNPYKETQITKEYLTSDVDRDIPVNYNTISNRYALVIGNEDYSSKQTNLSTEQDVAFARNDANSFKNYLISSLGFENEHVTILNDATSGEMNKEIEILVRLAKLDSKSEIVLYYAGHGFPDENKHPYLIPVDVSTINLSSGGISLKQLNSKLASSNAAKITVFLDACFSGGGRDLGLLAARGMKINPKEETFTGNMVVFASSSGEERSLPYKEKQHGFFTYFLLKKLQETKGNATYGELSEYIKKEVSRSSLLKKSLQQTPNTNISPNVQDKWKTWSFR